MYDSFSVKSIGAELEENLEMVQLFVSVLLLGSDLYGISYFPMIIHVLHMHAY